MAEVIWGGDTAVKICEACGGRILLWWNRSVWHPGCKFSDAIRSANEVNELVNLFSGTPR